MINRQTHYTKICARSGLLLALLLALSATRLVGAQEPLSALRLLAWSPGGSFLLGTTPAQTVTLSDGSLRQMETLWRLTAAGRPVEQLAQGFDVQLSADGRWVTFDRLTAQDQLSRWGIDVETGTVQPLDSQALAGPEVSVAGDPNGPVFISPDGRRRAILVNRFFVAELWVGEANQAARLILQSEGELFSDLAWRPDGQALALIRTPLGSQTETAGELWRIDLPDQAATRLSQNNVTDRSPLWSPDGTRLALIRNRQSVVVPSDRLQSAEFDLDQQVLISPPAPPLGAAAQLTPPATIRVIHHASNSCREVPVGQIDTIPFEEYVKRVVPNEVFSSWPAATLKAQAVAARTYGWDKYLQDPTADYHVTDWINHQYMCDDTVASTNQAVDDTAGEYLAYNGQMITAMFSAENSSPTRTNPYVAYLQAIDDPVSFGQTLNGHGYGMGQWGAQRWAAQHSWSYQAILRHYYTNVSLEEANTGSEANPPNVSLVAPWSNHYLTGNQLRLLANTSDDSGTISQTNIYLSTPAETNLLGSESGPGSSSGYLIDLSSWADQTLLAETLVFTAEAFDLSGKRGVSAPVTVGLDRVAPSGLLTTATTLTGTTLITEPFAGELFLTASDETAGASHVALGRKSWEWEGENLVREEVGGSPVGRPVDDAAALNGRAMQATDAADPAGSWSSTGLTFPAPRQYRTYFRLKVKDNAVGEEVARLEVLDNQSGTLIGLHRLRGVDFRAGDGYQEFHVDFDYPTAGVPVIFQLVFLDSADLTLDRLILVEYPLPLTTTPGYDASHFRLKVIDGAGNVSPDLLVLPAWEHQLYLPVVRTP